ncbi:MAG: ABC transporter permease [Eubacteriales bacterium]|nr:ABC transporter permease [Eubacteriales bacterium]
MKKLRNFKLVFGYEFKSLLGKKSTIITTIIMALIVFILFNVPRFMDWFSPAETAEDEKNPYEIITESTGYVFLDEQTGNMLKPMLQIEDEKIFSSREELVAAIENDELKKGFVVEEALKYESIWLDRKLEFEAELVLSEILKQMNISNTLIQKGISPEEVVALQSKEVESTTTVLGKDGTSNTIVAFVLLFIIYMLVIMYGQITSTVIAREKDSRTMELLITSTKASNLILGKVAASGLTAVVQLGTVALAGYIGFVLNKELLPQFIVEALSGTLTKEYLISYLYFTIVGYILYLFLYAALGSTVSKVEDVNSSTAPVSFLFMIGYFITSFSMTNPDSIVVVAGSIVPFTSLMVMPFRTAVDTVPMWQYILSGGLLLATTVLLALLSIRIYRQGTLNYGNKLGFIKSIKMAFNKN